MNVRAALRERGADIVGEESADGQTRLSVQQTCLNALYELRREFEAVQYVGVRGEEFVVDVCPSEASDEQSANATPSREVCDFDHDTRDNATWYGGDAGHDFYHCDGCDERLSFVEGDL